MIEIWAPFPYEVVALRPPAQGERYLSSNGEVETWHLGQCNAIYPVVKMSSQLGMDQVQRGLKGLFGDDDDERELVEKTKYTIETRSKNKLPETVVEYLYKDELGGVYKNFKPTKLLSLVEAWAPDGYKAIRYGKPQRGEEYVINEGGVVHDDGPEDYEAVILQRCGRPATIDDLGKTCRFSHGQSICRVGELAAVHVTEHSTSFVPRYSITNYSHCEIIE